MAIVEYKKPTGEVSFLKSVGEGVKIGDIKGDDLINQTLARMFAEISNLSGVNGEIEDINKKDIKDLILTRFHFLTVEEVIKAFTWERHVVVYDVKTSHYGKFNAEYVATVLKKYVNYKCESIRKNNLSTRKRSEIELEDIEKQKIVLSGLCRAYDAVLKGDHIDGTYYWMFTVLKDVGELPRPEENEAAKNAYELKMDLAQKLVKAELTKEREASRDSLDAHRLNSRIISVVEGNSQTVMIRFKEIVVESYFDKMKAKEVTGEEFKNRMEPLILTDAV